MSRKQLILMVGILSSCGVCLALLGLAAAIFFFVPHAQAKQLMHYTFTDGEQLSQQIVMDQTITMTMLGQEQTVEQTLGFGYDFAIVEIQPDNNARLECTYTWVKFTQDSDYGHIDYETTTPEPSINPADEDFLGQVYGAMVGEKFIIIISPDGRVVDVQGMDELFSHVIDKYEVEDAEKIKLQENIKSQFNEDTILDLMGNSLTPYSLEPVKVGDSWNATQNLSVVVPAIVDTTYTLIERKGGRSIIQVKSKISPDPDGKNTLAGLGSFTLEMEGEQEGQMIVDSSGWDMEGKIDQNMTIVMKSSSTDVSMDIHMILKSTVTITTTR